MVEEVAFEGGGKGAGMGPWSRRDEILGNSAWEAPNPPFGSKWPFRTNPSIETPSWSCFRHRFQNTKSGHSLRRPGYTIPAFSSRILIKNVFSANPRPSIRVAPPPISWISLLLTAHARNSPPPRSKVGAVRSEGRRVEGRRGEG